MEILHVPQGEFRLTRYPKRKKELLRAWDAADEYLLTSFNEGSPNILKEALACNVPVVSVDVGDAAERLLGLEMCAVCDFDAYSLAKPICRILENPGRPELRDKIRYLDNSLIADKINKLYQTLL